MEVIYRVNGKEFNTIEDAKHYEEELERKEQERIEKEEEKKRRFAELSDVANNYIRLKEAYEKDFGGNKQVDAIKRYEDIVDELLKFFK